MLLAFEFSKAVTGTEEVTKKSQRFIPSFSSLYLSSWAFLSILELSALISTEMRWKSASPSHQQIVPEWGPSPQGWTDQEREPDSHLAGHGPEVARPGTPWKSKNFPRISHWNGWKKQETIGNRDIFHVGNPWKSIHFPVISDFPFNQSSFHGGNLQRPPHLDRPEWNRRPGRSPGTCTNHETLGTVMYCVCQRFIDIQNISESFFLYSLGGHPKNHNFWAVIGNCEYCDIPKRHIFLCFAMFFPCWQYHAFAILIQKGWGCNSMK